jgi:hypothetical protein
VLIERSVVRKDTIVVKQRPIKIGGSATKFSTVISNYRHEVGVEVGVGEIAAWAESSN